MRILQKTKDGGKESTVDAYFLFEIKSLGSVAILKFNKGSRTNYHSHAFHALTWFLKGEMEETFKDGSSKEYARRLLPKFTRKGNMHKVIARKPSWCLTIRGPWSKTWEEFNPDTGATITLTHGRKEVARS